MNSLRQKSLSYSNKECCEMRRIIPLLLAMLFCFVGCVEIVDSFTIFSMEGFDPFFDFYTSQLLHGCLPAAVLRS